MFPEEAQGLCNINGFPSLLLHVTILCFTWSQTGPFCSILTPLVVEIVPLLCKSPRSHRSFPAHRQGTYKNLPSKVILDKAAVGDWQQIYPFLQESHRQQSGMFDLKNARSSKCYAHCPTQLGYHKANACLAFISQILWHWSNAL